MPAIKSFLKIIEFTAEKNKMTPEQHQCIDKVSRKEQLELQLNVNSSSSVAGF